MNDYLDDRMNNFKETTLDTFILIMKKNEDDPVEYENDDVVMEYDFFDDRLFIDKFFLNTFYKWFPISPEESKEFVKHWFEDRYNVEIKKVDAYL